MMIKISSLDQIREELNRIRDFKKGYFSNLFFDAEKFNLWIKSEILYFYRTDEFVFFFKKNASFYNVYYCFVSIESLSKGISLLKKIYNESIFVFDIVGTESGSEETCQVFNTNGYFLYTSLNRMSRLISSEQKSAENDSIRLADQPDLVEIHRLLYQYFDEYAEQLPLTEELKTWIEKKHLLLYIENKQIIGFSIFDIIGMTSYLRYWFVHPMHRNKKIGSSLLRRFFYEGRETKRQLFWVIENNENAILRYQHYGFKKENLMDYIYINIDKQYENKSD